MPELPEVETIKEELNRRIKGKKIAGVELLWGGILKIPLKKFTNAVMDARIKGVERRAKILLMPLGNGFTILMHLKMTGQLIYDSRFAIDDLRKILPEPKYKYARIIFFFKDKGALIFNDLRKFGYVKLVPTGKINEIVGKEKLGPEPLTPDFTLKKFQDILKKYPKRRIKQLLMDQAIISGIGNIYSDEICFYAKVLPVKPAGELSDDQIERLYDGIKKILLRAIKLRGSSVDNYVDASGKKGDYVKELKVYDREGEKCFRCDGIVKRIKLGGRSSYFCPICQK